LITLACCGSTCIAPGQVPSIPRTMAGDPGSEPGFGTGGPGGGSTCISPGQTRRDAGLQSIQELCGDRGWNLLAAHVRSHHVHTVVEAEAEPERVMHNFKNYASRRLTRRLTRMSLDEPKRKRRARHGSTRWLWKQQHVCAAIQFFTPSYGRGSDWLQAAPLLCRS